MKPKDILLVSISDMHSGSSRALFPNRTMQFVESETNHTPTPPQQKLYEHWDACLEQIKEKRKGKTLFIIHNGDATENQHHNTIQVIGNLSDHADIHLELMRNMLKRVGFSKKDGDKLFYVEGTESHTLTIENYIGKELGAEISATIGTGEDAKEYYAFPELKLDVNGRQFWYTHHGGAAGDGANEGDAYRNWLKRIYWNNLKQGKPQPDMVISAHVHKPIYTNYTQDWHTIHGMILPSWQLKTRYAYRAAPFQRNDIGLSMTEVSAQGDIRIMKSLVMEM